MFTFICSSSLSNVEPVYGRVNIQVWKQQPGVIYHWKYKQGLFGNYGEHIFSLHPIQFVAINNQTRSGLV